MKRTPLFETHKNLGAKMMEFGGWMMPVSYSGVLKEHRAVRQAAGLFDVSHMGELAVEGEDALRFLQWATCNDLGLMRDGQCQYNLLMNPDGGVIDDVIVHLLGGDRYFICVNASNTEKDFQSLKRLARDFKVKVENRSDRFSQLALQGPLAETILRKLCSVDLSSLKSFHFIEPKVDGRRVLLARTGYTGEDGFELYCENVDAAPLWNLLLQEGAPLGLVPCGLGARDTLRLEMAYPLYGHELKDDTTPFEAALGWVVKLSKGDFIGRGVLERQKAEGLSKKRVGFEMVEDGIGRADYPVFDAEKKVGWVTSGTYSPSLDKNIGCAYVPMSLAKIGAALQIEIRGKKKSAQVVATPFYKRPEAGK